MDNFQPRLWYDSESPTQNEGGDCNCDCACSLPMVDLQSDNLGIDESQLIDSLYCQADQLYWHELDAEHWIVSNPIGVGKIVVLNHDARRLLEWFVSPMQIAQMIENYPQTAKDSIVACVKQLIVLGILANVNSSQHAPIVQDSDVLTAWLHITNECNLRCDYCYLHKTAEQMSDEIVLQAVDAVFRSAVRHDFRRIKLKYAGGEASQQFARVLLAHDHAIKLSEQSGIGLDAVLLSNGVALSSTMIGKLKQRRIKVMISLDGIGDVHDEQRHFINGHGSFQHVSRTLQRLQDEDWVPDISITVSERNLDGLPALIDFVLSRELPFSLNYYRESDCSTSYPDLRYNEERMIEVMHQVFKQIEGKLPRQSLLGCLVDRANLNAPHQHTCGVGRNYLVIDQHGGVAKCQMDIKRTITNIALEDPLEYIRSDQDGIQNLSVDEKEGCKDCQWRYWCTGGCSFLTHRMTGRYDTKSPNCNIYKSLYPAVIRLEAIRLLKSSYGFVTKD